MKLLLLSVLVLSGCSLFQENLIPKMADVVDQYCAQSSYAVRQDIEKAVNGKVKTGTSVKVICPSDPK